MPFLCLATRRLWKSAVCAVAKEYNYYCEVKCKQEGVEPGVYRVRAVENPATHWFPKLQGIIRMSDRVWKQGPQGGVKVIKSRDWQHPLGYVTNNEKYMEQFIWVKLTAKDLA